MTLFPDIYAAGGYAVRVGPEPRVVPGVNPETPSRTVWENTIAGRDVQNGPVTVTEDSTVLAYVPSGAVYEVRITNVGTGNIYVALGQRATLQHFEMVPGQVGQWRIAGEQGLNAVAGVGLTETVRVWVSRMAG